MGLDFIRAATQNFHKGLDRDRADLSTPDLFTHVPDCEPRAYAAKIWPNKKLHPGEDVGIRLHHGQVLALRGIDVVAEFEAPPAEFVEALEASYGEACGTVVEVYEIANVAEISAC